MRVLDLFSGIGGFSVGLEATGMQTVAFCEPDKYCQKVLKKNWPEVPIYDDVRELTADRLVRDGIRPDIITGGFPCQDISVAGKQAGIEGERSGLWSECARLLSELRPQYAIFENVTNLLTGEVESVSKFPGIFPRSGMMRSGTVYQLAPLAHRTDETEYSLWPTPTAMTGGEGIAPSHIEGTHGWSLGAAAKDSLSEAPIRMWPTPAARDYKGARKPETMAKTGRNPETNSLPDSVEFKGESGRLNPTWVEWLMGYPIGHTELED